ncbi:ABC transporter permease [Paenibacillus eucommiae]|uniref:Sulfonate transport system permease protein n=1 Tax=Paenibacillus eucommiae TaxID=1355755 RepID=A0ABS4J6A4_9BACL|nr:ABC transporter permease [Paenibacillus eucommiae]MBP1995343.1 sulfonate transport system permease protein [Paenibacillus eucommiae]
MSSKERVIRLVLGSLIPVVVLVVWQVAVALELLNPMLFPGPISIFRDFYDMIMSGELFHHLGISVMRAMVGFAIGGASGLVAGIAVGLFRRTEHIMDPTIQMLRTVPLLAVTPLFILWFGFGELSKVLLISMGAFFPLYVNSFLGVRNVDAKLFDVARVLEFSRFHQITKVILPAAMPNILLGVRLSLSVSWLCLVVAELMGADQGIGYLIQDARAYLRTGVVFVGIFIFAIVGKLTDSLVRILEARLLKWQDSYRG